MKGYSHGNLVANVHCAVVRPQTVPRYFCAECSCFKDPGAPSSHKGTLKLRTEAHTCVHLAFISVVLLLLNI